jgi:hypothetical protein
MNRNLWWSTVWAPWLALAVGAVFYVDELLREMAGEGWGLGESVFHFGLAALLVGALALFVDTVAEEWLTGHARDWVRRLVFWTPRLALLLFGGLIAMLALDVSELGLSGGQLALAFVMHALPGLALLAAALLAWRWPWVGAIICLLWVGGWLFVGAGRGFPPSVYAELAGLPLALALLFAVNWWYGRDLRRRR